MTALIRWVQQVQELTSVDNTVTSNVITTCQCTALSVQLNIADHTPVAATVTIQDVAYTAVTAGSVGNAITVAYTTGGTAGAEVVTVTGNAISVKIESATSTSGDIVTAITNSVTASALVTTAYTDDGSTAQTAPVSATHLADGSDSDGSFAGSAALQQSNDGVTFFTVSSIADLTAASSFFLPVTNPPAFYYQISIDITEGAADVELLWFGVGPGP